MRSSLTLLKNIQAAAGGDLSEQIRMDDKPSSAPAVAPKPVEEKSPAWPRAEIIAALEKGSTAQALAFSLQAIGALAKDQTFADAAAKLTKPTDPGEAWKRAYKTYSRYVQQIRAAAQSRDTDAACELFSKAAEEVAEIFSCVCPGDPMCEQLSIAVYEALGAVYSQPAP